MTAVRIDHRGVNLPAPSIELIDRMAVTAYDTICEQNRLIGLIPPNAKILTWAEARDDRKDAWRVVSRNLYAVVARSAGAKITEMPEK